MSKTSLYNSWPYMLAVTLLWYATSGHPFFWDTLHQASRVGHWYYEQGFQSLSLPDQLDSGHPPLFGYALALIWKIFSKSLFISHLAVLPLIWGIVWQLHHLIVDRLDASVYHWAMLVALADATLLAQFTLVSPELVLIFAFLWALNAVHRRRPIHLSIAGVLLVAVSIRGLFLLAALGLYALWNHRKHWQTLTWLWPFVPAALCALAYYYWHFVQTGWWVSTPGASWGGQRGLASVQGVLRNGAVFAWRLLDFGRFFWWALLSVLLFRLWRRGRKVDGSTQGFLAMIICLLMVFLPVFLLLNNPIGHRYLLPLFLMASLMCVHLLFMENWQKPWPKVICVGLLLFLFSGNFWIYPRHISQGWDASLAYLPYFEQRRRMIDFIEQQDIPLEEIGTEFPNKGPLEWIELDGGNRQFAAKDLSTQRYIFYSNVFNDFSDEELVELVEKWRLIQAFSKRGVSVELYEKKE